ncbi:ABC transporter ATP-binding protein [Aurantimonas sp. C2-6-R+9]|uniref:ABC transporter ATP-binding protein n=1 Tax=unclassified Aurantimonas TaxID=2638230 RepID=UPI002E19B027|nr:ABC transporter ATP-binding protein [Aurantimonas sp. C2-6-R+9]
MRADSMSGIVEVRDLNHVYSANGQETEALKDIHFTVETGSFVSIVGPSGCGKSSLLMMLAGLIKPTSGTIIAKESPMAGPDPSRIGVVFQDASLYPWLTAQHNVEFPLSLRGVKKPIRREKARDALALVGLTDFAGSYPHELSGGMKQRVSIARGLVQDPPILLMDEPFAALDEQTRIQMGDELLRIWDQTRKTVIFVTHGLSEALYLSDEVIVLSGRPGRILDRVRVDLPRPRTLEVMAKPRFAELRDRIWQMIKT